MRRPIPESTDQRMPNIAFCERKQELLDSFTAAVHALSVLQGQQVDAIVGGDPEFNRFDLLIHMAVEKKHQAKYEYMSHVERHGC